MKRGLLSYLLLFLLACGATNSGTSSNDKRDVILVLDTSYSMAGSGGRDIIADVKESINRFIDSLNDGDRLTFATFDTDMRFYETVLIDDANDRDIAKKFISNIPATGQWTHTYRMLDKLFAKAEELQGNNDGREISLVVMTDGLDDPPPAIKTDKINIKDISTKYEGRDWWIYFVSYQELKEKTAQRQQFESNLKKVSEKTVIVDVDPEKQSVHDEIINTVNVPEKKAIPWQNIVIPIVLLLLLLLLFFILRKRRAQLKVRGNLEYWNNDMIKPNVERFDMTRHNLKEIQVGSKMGCQLRLIDLEIKMPFKIVAVRHNKEIKADVVIGDASLITFVNGAHGKFLENGEVFNAGNFSFRYME